MGMYILAGTLGIGIIAIILAYLIYRKDKGAFTENIRIPLFSGKFSEKPSKSESRKVEQAPLSGMCNKCKKTVSMPFKCKFCSTLYCPEHRLPESHSCTNLPSPKG